MAVTFRLEAREGKKGGFYVYDSESDDLIGDAIYGDDGYYYLWPNEDGLIAWPAHFLHELGDLLDKLNEAWDAEVDRFLRGQGN